MHSGRGRRTTLMLATLCVGMFAVNVDFFSINLAIPDIAHDLDASATDLQWAVSATLLGLGATLITAGRLGDIFGRRPVYLCGTVVFGVSSLLCGLAGSVGFLVAMRALQGVGGAMVMPLSMAILTNAYADTARRQRAIGLVYGVGAIGSGIGPFVGGVLTEHVGWEWVFFFNVPFALGALVLGFASVPDSRDEAAPRRIDLPGVALVGSGVVAVSYAFDRGPDWGWGSARFLGVLGAGVAALGVFVVVERQVRFPLVDLGLFRNRAFVVVTAAGWVANTGFVIALFAGTLYLQRVEALSPLDAGVLFLAPSTAVALAGPLSARLAAVLRPEHVGAVAVVVGGLGLLVETADSTWAWFVPGFAVMGLGYGIGWTYASVGTQAVVAPRQAGAASGVTLTVVIAGAGMALVLATSGIEELSGGVPTRDGVFDVLRIVALASLAAGGLLMVLARRSTRLHAATTSGQPPGP